MECFIIKKKSKMGRYVFFLFIFLGVEKRNEEAWFRDRDIFCEQNE